MSGFSPKTTHAAALAPLRVKFCIMSSLTSINQRDSDGSGRTALHHAAGADDYVKVSKAGSRCRALLDNGLGDCAIKF